MKIFFDTNVLVSAFTAHGLSAELVRYVLAEHEFMTGAVNLAELRRTLAERFHAPDVQIREVEAILREQTVVPRPAAPSPLKIRDPDDAWVLASALDGKAELLVTGDKDLLALAGKTALPILSPRQAWELLRQIEPEDKPAS